MPIETIELTGSGITGIVNGGLFKASNLPTRVCLGRIAPAARPACLRMDAYLPHAMALPPASNWRDKAMPSLNRMYVNDQLGCCVFSSVMHRLGVWSANDSDSGGIVLATDAEVRSQYFAYTGGRDVGANIAEVLDIMRSRGFVASGKTYKIDGYISVDWTKWDLVRAAIAIFGNVTIGFDLPGSWSGSDTWDVSNAGRTVGGHDVTAIDYTDDYVLVSSWGRLYKFTRAAFTSRRWIGEAYVSLAPLWYNADNLAPSGVDVDQLRADLAKIDGGEVPNVEPPSPEIPVQPDHIRITVPLGKGSYAEGKIILGSNIAPGEYAIVLGGEGPPPVNPD